MTTPGLTAKIVRLHEALEEAALPHAFGGALALAFCTQEPRATQDIDLNIFVGVAELAAVEAALTGEVRLTAAERRMLLRDAQARLWWGDTPVDIFLSNHPFHDHAEANRRRVPFAGVNLPVLACPDLAVFKAFFGRLKDAVDIAAMVAAGAVQLEALRDTVSGLLGADERVDFFARVEAAIAETAT